MNYQDALITVALFITILSLYLIHANKSNDLHYMGLGSIGLELLGVVLSVYWAVTIMDDFLLSVFFVLAWVAMVAIRAAVLPKLITNATDSNWTRFSFGFSALLIAYIALYSTGLFHALNSSGDAAQTRLNDSAPALSLDTEIVATQSRIARLAGFSNADKAHAEQQEIKANASAAQNQHSAYMVKIAEQNAILKSCPANYLTRCIRPASREIARLETELNALTITNNSSEYAKKYNEYEGLQRHLVDLQKRRAALSASGQGVQSAWRPDDRFLAWVFGITPEKANSVKWLIFTFIFDALAALVRIYAALNTRPNSANDELKKKFIGLLNNGFSIQDAVNALGIGTVKNAIVEKTPALLVGGRILENGLYNGHANEFVLNPKATAWADKNLKGWLEQINRGVFNMPLTEEKARKKGDICNCTDCKAEFTAKHKNHVRCTECGTAVKTRYAKTYKS